MEESQPEKDKKELNNLAVRDKFMREIGEPERSDDEQ